MSEPVIRRLRPKISTTLPRNFTFRYADGEQPRTPEPEPMEQSTPEPPEAPRQRLRIKRRRAPFPVTESEAPSDIPLPTIETSDLPAESLTYLPEPTSETSEGYLAPSALRSLISPPKTPISQIGAGVSLDLTPNDWNSIDLMMHGDSIVRPLSACSGMSDSSVSSSGSLLSFPSFGGSCTSPESDAAEPFQFPCASPSAMIFSPQLNEQSPPMQYKKRKVVWTQEMDDHLLYTYIKLAQDPLITPFKSLPGTAPPLGICSQVAREARRTWKASKSSSAVRSVSSSTVTGPSDCAGSLQQPSRSGSETPTGPSVPKQGAQWPAKNKEGRKRLRELCKRKPALSAHYSRLMRMRSPSPFSSSNAGPSDPQQSTSLASGVSNREMHISLATSSASTMQPGNPLSQLAGEDSTEGDRESSPAPPPSIRLNGLRLNTHQKSQSLHIGTGVGAYHRHSAPRQLASPFVARPMYSSLRSQPNLSESRSNEPVQATRSLHAPLELRAPMPLPRSFKRRALHHILRDDAQSKDYLKQLFGDTADTSDRRVRDRGFSLGDMGAGARRLTSVFVPPPQIEEPMQIEPTAAPSSSDAAQDQSNPDSIPRLRSPFSPNGTQFNTFPRLMAAPHFDESDPFASRLGGRGSSSLSRAFLQHQL